VAKVYSLVRKQIHIYMQNEYRRYKLGKFGRGVEIDESVFAERKGGEKIWVLGFFERDTKEGRAIFVKDRTESTLT
jgi:hypothetical protein